MLESVKCKYCNSKGYKLTHIPYTVWSGSFDGFSVALPKFNKCNGCDGFGHVSPDDDQIQEYRIYRTEEGKGGRWLI